MSRSPRLASSPLSLVTALVLGMGALACSGKSPSPTSPPPAPTVTDPTPPLPTDSGDPNPAVPAQPSGKLPPGISGGTLLVLRDGSAAIASDPDRDRIYVVDLATRQLRGQIALEDGAEPGRAIEDSAGRVHVALRGGGAVLTLDPRDARMLARRALCPAPRGLAFDASKQLLHVACAGGELISIAPVGDTPTRTLNLDRDLRDVLVRGDKLLVSSFRKAELLTVGPSAVEARVHPPATTAAFNASGKPGVVMGPNGAMIGSENASAAVAWRLVAGPGTQALVLHQRGLDSEVGTQPNAYGSGPSCAGIVEAAVSSYDDGPVSAGSANVGKIRSGGALTNAVLAVDVAVSPDGKQLAVVSAGNGGTDQQVLFYSTEEATSPPSNPSQPCVPGAPVPVPGMGEGDPDGGVGPTASPDGGVDAEEGYEDPIEYRPPNGQVIAVAYDPRGNIIVQSREPATLQILTQRAAPIVLSSERRADPGHQLFHGATPGKLACASCHPEGGEDGRTWKFAGLGARRTQSLRGGVMDTAPFHWNGDMPSLDFLMHDVFQGRMSGPKVDRTRMDQLATWLDNVKTIKPSGWHPGTAVTRGKALFESTAACSTCHRGPDFTNGASFDVGTGGTFQVPQLHNLAFRGPFLHDGCAGTLLERFTKCGSPGDRHGLTSKLTPAQIDDLVAYLETL
jgi:hypothetical protein